MVKAAAPKNGWALLMIHHESIAQCTDTFRLSLDASAIQDKVPSSMVYASQHSVIHVYTC